MTTEKVVSQTTASRPIRYVSIEPGRISLHGVALTDDEYHVLLVISERMKHSAPLRAASELLTEEASC